VQNANQLTGEQRQLLAQMQADMRQQPTQLNEVPWNEQTAAQRQQTLQRQRQQQQVQQQQAQQQQWSQTQTVQQPKTQPRVTEQPYQQSQQQTRTVQTQPTQQPKQNQPYQDLLQTPAHTTAQQSKTQPAAPVTSETEAPKQTAEKKDERRWMVQCGSFKGAEQAETVRAQLAFEGFDSRITTNNGWNRVVIGPVKGKENADGTISRLKVAGHTNCIRLASGG
jgi:cell division protein FtsN